MAFDSNLNILYISKAELALLPAAKFEGRIVVVENSEQLKKAIDKIYKSSIIGFDTETRPSFKKGQINEVSLIQIATPEECFLFRINKTGFSPLLIRLFENPDITKIGLSIHDDFHNLFRISEFSPSGFIDLQQYVKKFHIEDTSLSKIYAIIFGKRISKGQRLTNWESNELTDAQQAYASLDAKACIDIYKYLYAGKFKPDTSKYIHTYKELEAYRNPHVEESTIL